MRKGLFREPIHLNSSNRGKLRKVEYHRVQKKEADTNLLLVPTHILGDSKAQKKQKHHFYFKKQQYKGRYESFYDTKITNNEDSSEIFRAIHTASPSHSLRKVPLRSITPIKPYRKQTYSHQKGERHTVEIAILRQEMLSRKFKQMKNGKVSNTSEIVSFHSPALSSRYNQNEEGQQFYQYRYRKSPFSGLKKIEQEENHKISGTKIEPFKKYQIRDVHKSGYSHRNYEYPLIMNQ